MGKRCHKHQSDPQSRYIKRYSTAIRIHDGAFDTNWVDTTTGRFHSPLVRLKKELWPTVTYGGKRLVSVDIKNSQPELMLGLLNPKVLPYNNLSEKVYHYNLPIFTVYDSIITSQSEKEYVKSVMEKQSKKMIG